MSESISETPQQQAERVRDIAALATLNPEKFREEVKTLTESQLNALANIFIHEEKEQLSQAVKTEVKARLESLDAVSVDENLETLLDRIPAVRIMLNGQPASSSERLRQDVDTATNQVTGFVSGTYEYVQQHVMKPIAERTKNMFLIGPLISSMADWSPSHISKSVSRKWYQILASTETFSGIDSKGFFGKIFFKMADGARQKLAFLDVLDVIEEYQDEKKLGETISLDEKVLPDQWRKMRDLIQKNPQAMAERAAALITQHRQANVLAIRITAADILKTDAEVQDQAKIERLVQFKTKVLALSAWKNVSVTEVSFSAEETSLGNGMLTVVEADLDESGNAKPATRAAALLEAKKALTNAEKIIIAKDAKDVVTLNWNAPRSVTLPMQTAVDTVKINDLARTPQPDRFSILEIGASDVIANDEVQLMSRNGANVLIAENNPAVLAAIAQGKPTIDTSEPSPKYKYHDGEFTLMPAPMPVPPLAG